MKIVSVACGQKYYHMIDPFINSARKAGYDPVVYSDTGHPLTRKVEFTDRGDKLLNMLSKMELWVEAVREHGQCLLMDIDIIILGTIDLPDADVVFTVDKRFSISWDYVNMGVFYCRSLGFIERLYDVLKTVDIKRASEKPYLGPTQMAFHLLTGFEKGKTEYTVDGDRVTGVPCEIYNHYNDSKKISRSCKVLHYKNRWQGGCLPSPEKMKIINGYIDAPVHG